MGTGLTRSHWRRWAAPLERGRGGANPGGAVEGKPRTPLSSRVATRFSWSPLSGLKAFASPLVSLALPTFVKCMCCSDVLWKVPFLDPIEVLPKGYRSIHYSWEYFGRCGGCGEDVVGDGGQGHGPGSRLPRGLLCVFCVRGPAPGASISTPWRGGWAASSPLSLAAGLGPGSGALLRGESLAVGRGPPAGEVGTASGTRLRPLLLVGDEAGGGCLLRSGSQKNQNGCLGRPYK